MAGISNQFEYRVANDADAVGIRAVLEEVAPEIPLLLDTTESKEVIQAIIADCCSTGESWVAVDASGAVIGFVLAKPDRLERFFHENQALSLRYIGVKKLARRRGVFAALMEKYIAKGVPLTASVLHGNRGDMANRLVKIGFKVVEADTKEMRFKRD